MNQNCKDVYQMRVIHFLHKDVMFLLTFLFYLIDFGLILDLLLCFCWKCLCFVVFFTVKLDTLVLSIKILKWFIRLPDQVHYKARTYYHSDYHDITNVIMRWETMILLDDSGNIIYETYYCEDKHGVFSCLDLLEFPVRVVVQIFYLQSPCIYWIFARVFHS